jgi:hypothetical protein
MADRQPVQKEAMAECLFAHAPATSSSFAKISGELECSSLQIAIKLRKPLPLILLVSCYMEKGCQFFIVPPQILGLYIQEILAAGKANKVPENDVIGATFFFLQDLS